MVNGERAVLTIYYLPFTIHLLFPVTVLPAFTFSFHLFTFE